MAPHDLMMWPLIATRAKLRRRMENFSVNASTLGYLYQARYALFLLLSKAETEAEISIARLDDISFEREGNPIELLQTGHHIKSTASLSDISVDFWKTLGRWSVAVAERRVNPGRTILTLITAGRASNGSAASMLRPGAILGRDTNRALQILLEVAGASESRTNQPAYEAFVNLSAFQQRALIRSVHILDSSPDILDTRDQILKRLRLITRPQFVEVVYERVEGWWFTRLIQRMSSDDSTPISYRELLDHIQNIQRDIQRQLYADGLPIEFRSIEFLERTAWDEHKLGQRDRAFIELNPAFCGELIRRLVKAHNSFADHQIPFPLIFLALPIVLHRRTRESISANTREQMHVWLQSHQDARIGFAERARELVPVTREAMAFLLQHGAIAVDNRAGLRLTRYISRNVPASEEISDCYRKAEILGRWFARAGSPAAIYTMWGVRP
jgi:hypothetical protein